MKSLKLHQLVHDLRNRNVRLSFCLTLAVGGFLVVTPNVFSRAHACDRMPTGVETEDYYLDFKVPIGLMPDPQFDGRDARIHVHRIKPEYANGKCTWAPNQAV